jgi:rhamnulokinase
MSDVRTAAIDLGASTGRIVIAQICAGRLLLQEAHRFATPMIQDPETGYTCWDLERIESEVLRGLTFAEALPIQSLGIDAWGVDHVLLDQDLRRVGPAVSYRDGRTEGVMARVFRRLPAERIYQGTGIQLLPINSLFQLAQTAQAHPDWMERTRHFLMVPDYLNFRLCGVLANEYTNATTTQMYRIAGDDWDSELLAVAGLKRAQMLSPVEPGTVLAEIAQPFGSGQRVALVAPATHDTASAVAAIPFEDENETFISSGTWSIMGFESFRPYADAVARGFNFSNEGGVERRYRVLKNIPGLWQIQKIAKEMGLGHGDLVQAADSAQPWVSLINPWDDKFINPPSMNAAIQQFCSETGQPVPSGAGPLARCVFESLALAYGRVKEEIETLRGHAVTRIRIVGGGSQNRLLNQLCADACQVPVTAGPTETSAIGNACVQLMAMGVFRDLGEAREAVRRSYPVELFEPSRSIPEAASRRFKSLLQLEPSGGQRP